MGDYIISIGNNLLMIWQSFVPVNADKEIKDTNKIVARWQENKILQKPGSKKDKTDITKPMTNQRASYLVGLMHYTFMDAVMNAQATAISEHDRQCTKITSISLCLSCVIGLMNASTGRIILMILIYLYCYIMKDYKYVTMVNNLIGPTRLIAKILAIIKLILDIETSIPNGVKQRIEPYYGVFSILAIIILR